MMADLYDHNHEFANSKWFRFEKSKIINQYIYNHLDNRKLVPEISDESTVEFTQDGSPKDEVIFTIDETSSYADKKVVKKRIEDEQGNVSYDFFEFIGKRIGGGYAYYRLDPDMVTTENVAVYRRIAPLGYRSSFIEYEYGKDASDINTVIRKNELDYDPLEDIRANFSIGDEAIDYESMPDYPEFDISAYSSEAASAAFQQVYGAPMTEEVQSQDNIDTIPPNTGFTDANGEEICGGGIIVGVL